MKYNSNGKVHAFLRVSSIVTVALWAVLLLGVLLDALGAPVVAQALQVTATIPWVLLEPATGIPGVLLRPLGALLTGILCGVNASISR
mgnify:FL=1